MRQFRRLFSLTIGLLAIGWALGPSARGTGPVDPAAAPAAGLSVEVELADGTKKMGEFKSPTIRIQTEFGIVEFDPVKVKQLDLESTEGKSTTASAMLFDESHFSGSLVSELSITSGGKPIVDRPSDVQIVRFKHRKDSSLLAIIVGLVTLTFMEIVLGIDNIIFLAIVAGKLPPAQQPKARRIGLLAALGTRLLLLAFLSFLLGLTRPIFTLPDLPMLHTPEARGVSWRDLILLVGGTFLIGKSVHEMHEKMEHAREHAAGTAVVKTASSFAAVIVEISIIDIIFSLDSVITAVGMVDELWVMITAMLIAVGVMMVAAEPIARFVDAHPTLKILALSFLILIGVLLVAEGLGQHIDKGYIYFAMAFGVGVEVVNMRLRGHAAPAPEAAKPSTEAPPA